MLQHLVVALLLIGCTAYAGWALMPAAARRALATALLKLPLLPSALTARLRKAATASSGCGCDGCDNAPNTPAAKAPQVVTFHRKR